MARGRHGRRVIARGWKVAFVAIAVLGLLGGGTAFAAYRYDRSTAARILPGVTIDGVPVGDMTRQQAIRTVERKADLTLGGALSVTASGHSWTVTPAQLGMRADVEAAVDRAFSLADSMSFVSRVWHRVRENPVNVRLPLSYSYDDAAMQSFVQDAFDQVEVPAVNARIALVDDELVTRRSRTGLEMKMGMALDRLRSALEDRASSVAFPIRTVQPDVSTASLGKTIVVDLSDLQLTLYQGLKVDKQYPVATAAPGYVTPVGTWQVVNKVENPTWYNPAPTTWGAGEPMVIPPGPDNPLGTRALYLNAPGIRIHGTPASYSIGTHASHGCIRMYISDSEQLYPLVPVGTKVIIKP